MLPLEWQHLVLNVLNDNKRVSGDFVVDYNDRVFIAFKYVG